VRSGLSPARRRALSSVRDRPKTYAHPSWVPEAFYELLEARCVQMDAGPTGEGRVKVEITETGLEVLEADMLDSAPDRA